MAVWLETFSKLLALAFDTKVVPEQQAAMAKATNLAERHKCTIGQAYLRVGHRDPTQYRYLEDKRRASGIASIETQVDRANSLVDPQDSLAAQAMKACTIHPSWRRARA